MLSNLASNYILIQKLKYKFAKQKIKNTGEFSKLGLSTPNITFGLIPLALVNMLAKILLLP